TIAGTGVRGSSGDDGQATAAELNNPEGLAVDSSGNIYFADYNNHRVRKIDPSGIITTFGTFTRPLGVDVDNSGNIYVGDQGYLSKMTPAGTVTIIAGIGFIHFSGDGGKATDAHISTPRGIVI